MIFRTRFSLIPTAIVLAALSAASAFALVLTPEVLGVPNSHQVAAGIYRGAAPTAKGLSTLKGMKIHTIIDLRISPKEVRVEKEKAESMGFVWINIPMGREAPTQKQVDSFLSTLAKAPQEPVFVHCQHGADRTGCMIGIYRVQVQGWGFAQTWTEMRKYGFKPYLSELKEAVRKRVRPGAHSVSGK